MVDVMARTAAEEGGERTLAAMDDNGLLEIGRKTYRFVRMCMQDPALRAKIEARAAQLRAGNTGKEDVGFAEDQAK